MAAALSIITICYHNPAELEDTLKSLAELDPALFEVLVVDGSRDDACAEVAAKFPDFHYRRESDHGKYDAMNRGIRLAAGSAVLFMNSGDKLYSAAALADIVRQHRAELSATLIYGDCIRLVGDQAHRVPAPPLDENGLRRGVLPSHQSVLIPTGYHREHLYDDSMEFAADTKFLKQALMDLPRLYVPLPIGTFSYGGVSTAAASWSRLRRQYRELCEVEELRPFERLGVAFMLVRRKLLGSLLGPAGLQKLQAGRVSKSAAQSA